MMTTELATTSGINSTMACGDDSGINWNTAGKVALGIGGVVLGGVILYAVADHYESVGYEKGVKATNSVATETAKA